MQFHLLSFCTRTGLGQGTEAHLERDLNILFIIPNLSHGGIQTQVFLLADFLALRGYEVTIVGLFNAQDGFISGNRKPNIKVEFYPEIGYQVRNYFKLSFTKKIRFWFRYVFWLRSFKPDVIMPYTNSIDIFTNVVWRLTGSKLSFTFERGGHLTPQKERPTWMSRLRRWSKPVYVANSEHGALAMSKIRSIPFQQVKVIRNSLDLAKVNNQSPLPDFFKDIDGHNIVFLMVANFFNEKDHMFLLRSWLGASLDNARLIIFGLGSGRECLSNFENCKSFIAEHKLNNVILAGGLTPSPEVFQRAHAGVLSSSTEGCPNAVMEYMYFGLPVISRNIPGVEELVSNENFKLLSSLDSVNELAQTFVWCANNLEQCSKIGEANRLKAAEEFANDKMQTDYMTVFKDYGIR